MRLVAASLLLAVVVGAGASAGCHDARTLWIAPNAGETAIHLIDVEPHPF